ncbi:transposase [Vibrio sp. SCSIO 43136]|uniref:transposase n=1 Tax=Vibrio sp. SCSIO 43136 TaxID=2819101 RepID=UPI0020756E1B|nr:transposase [Vibrio sp. SCSIO 43136]USD64307.1 transposase [Vibrio sp. SCSIO 43136]
MTTARKQLVAVDATPYYHCISRCVRRSFLCGIDSLTNTNCEHRRAWVEAKILSLTQMYCINVCAYAVMSNHFHVVLHIDRSKALALSQDEVVERWGVDHKLPALIQRWRQKQLTCQAEEQKCSETIEIWRERLWSLSWFMKELNYDIACKANREDNCTGHFWESRFKSQALLDEKALAAAVAYVDLNPVRAGVAKTPESSDFTSIKARIDALNQNQTTAPCLHPFVGSSNNLKLNGIPFRLIDYLELIDWTARQFREGKYAMETALPPILDRLDIDSATWFKACVQLERPHVTAVGSISQIECAKAALNKTKIHLYSLG